MVAVNNTKPQQCLKFKVTSKGVQCILEENSQKNVGMSVLKPGQRDCKQSMPTKSNKRKSETSPRVQTQKKRRMWPYMNLNKVQVNSQSGTSRLVTSQKSSGRVKPKVEPARRKPNGCSLSEKTVQIGCLIGTERCGPSACAFTNQRQSHGSNVSDLTSERSSKHDHYSDYESVKKKSLAFHASNSTVDSNGFTSSNVPMSPKKALRVAMLKSRFADTIFKATHQTIMDHGDKSDPARMKLERERLAKEKREDKAKIEAEIKAASRRAQNVLKAQREKEREAARMTLQKMERTVEIEDNLAVMRDFEMLICPTGRGFKDRILDLEEGEILS